MQGLNYLAITVLVAFSCLMACSVATPTVAPFPLSPRPVSPTVEKPPPSWTASVAVVATKPAATSLPTATVVPTVWLVVTNTDGIGVYLRNSPNMDDKTVAWPDGTRLRIIGPDTENGGRRWKQVADPQGRTGWVPAEYTALVIVP
jgi:hypothetical protein